MTERRERVVLVRLTEREYRELDREALQLGLSNGDTLARALRLQLAIQSLPGYQLRQIADDKQ